MVIPITGSLAGQLNRKTGSERNRSTPANARRSRRIASTAKDLPIPEKQQIDPSSTHTHVADISIDRYASAPGPAIYRAMAKLTP